MSACLKAIALNPADRVPDVDHLLSLLPVSAATQNVTPTAAGPEAAAALAGDTFAVPARPVTGIPRSSNESLPDELCTSCAERPASGSNEPSHVSPSRGGPACNCDSMGSMTVCSGRVPSVLTFGVGAFPCPVQSQVKLTPNCELHARAKGSVIARC